MRETSIRLMNVSLLLSTKECPTLIHVFTPDIEVGGFLEMIRFFTTLILNADESTTM